MPINCISAANVTVASNGCPQITLTTEVSDVRCKGGFLGSIDLTVTGGVATYSYQWSNGWIFQDAYLLQAGSYTVVVTDANGCTATTSATVSEPATELQVDANAGPILCQRRYHYV